MLSLIIFKLHEEQENQEANFYVLNIDTCVSLNILSMVLPVISQGRCGMIVIILRALEFVSRKFYQDLEFLLIVCAVKCYPSQMSFYLFYTI